MNKALHNGNHKRFLLQYLPTQTSSAATQTHKCDSKPTVGNECVAYSFNIHVLYAAICTLWMSLRHKTLGFLNIR
jgi:hypothetical protein